MPEVDKECSCFRISRSLEQELKVNIPTRELRILVELEENVNDALKEYKGNLVEIPEFGENVYILYISTMIIRIEKIDDIMWMVDLCDVPSFINRLNS